MSLSAPPSLSIDASRLAFGIVAARYNEALVDALLRQVSGRLCAAGAKGKRIKIVRVPGSAELPYAALALAQGGRLDAVLALGVLIRGETIHYELISASVAGALQAVALQTRTPVINGVIVAETPAQARQRCLGKIARGAEFADAALEMAALKRVFSK